MATTDIDLLQKYVQGNSQEAFAELVRTHLNLVYSAALRQVRSPERVEEVAQSVFTDLSQNAAHLRPNTILTSWHGQKGWNWGFADGHAEWVPCHRVNFQRRTLNDKTPRRERESSRVDLQISPTAR